MARKDWKKKYSAKGDSSPIYGNSKENLYIVREGKQLGRFDNFQDEKFPVIIQTTGGREIEISWFNTKSAANRYMRSYMRSH